MRRQAREVRVGTLVLGGGQPIRVQSMTKTDTRDHEATAAQIACLEAAGCELVRVAVPDEAAARALPKIRAQVRIPLVADIHFNHRLALSAIDAGVDKVRINPGNLGVAESREVARACASNGVAIRIGVNMGSLEADAEKRYGRTAQALVESALRYAALLEEEGLSAIVLSLKSSDVPRTLEAYRQVASRCDYPLHLGVTEAGSGTAGVVKSALGIGCLLASGIGDTLRVSLTAPPEEEVRVGQEILQSLGLRVFSSEVISCPGCGRTEAEIERLVDRARALLPSLPAPLRIAIMGCVVNGPGEASECDVGLACGRRGGVIFKKGTPVEVVHDGNELFSRFWKHVLDCAREEAGGADSFAGPSPRSPRSRGV